MEEELVRFLISDEAAALRAQAEALAGGETLAALTALRKRVTAERAAAAWDLALLRRRARTRLGPDGARLFFDREGYEMASSAASSAYHARRFARAGVAHVLDLCGGVGLDALAFARAGLRVTLYERDPARAVFAAANARVLDLSDKITVVAGDAVSSSLPSADAVWLDPMRRSGARRWTVEPEQTEPPLSIISDLQARGYGAIGVKASPALDHRVAAQYGADLEFLSDAGECKEALLWLGGLKNGDALAATLVPEDLTLSAVAPQPAPVRGSFGAYLLEPDPAVIRANLVGVVAREADAWLADPGVTYLFSDREYSTPFAATYRVDEHLPYDKKTLQAALRRRDAGRVIIKKRAFPLEPEDVRRELKLTGTREEIVVLARFGARAHAFIVRRVGPSPPPATGGAKI